MIKACLVSIFLTFHADSLILLLEAIPLYLYNLFHMVRGSSVRKI